MPLQHLRLMRCNAQHETARRYTLCGYRSAVKAITNCIMTSIAFASLLLENGGYKMHFIGHRVFRLAGGKKKAFGGVTSGIALIEG